MKNAREAIIRMPDRRNLVEAKKIAALAEIGRTAIRSNGNGEAHMIYQIGDVIVHWAHGVGKIVAIEAKEIAGSVREYYVVEIKQLKVWVPVAHDSVDSIHFPIGSVDFCTLLNILKTPGDGLPDDQYKRRLELSLRMKQQTLEDICRVI